MLPWVEEYREEGSQVIESDDLNDYVPEGVEAMVSYKGSVVDIIRQLVGGLRSGLSLLWCKDNSRNAKECKVYKNYLSRIYRKSSP